MRSLFLKEEKRGYVIRISLSAASHSRYPIRRVLTAVAANYYNSRIHTVLLTGCIIVALLILEFT